MDNLEQVCRHFGILHWRKQLSALLDLTKNTPDKVQNVSSGVAASPGILVGIHPFDYLIYQGDADAHETAVRAIKSKVQDRGIFVYDGALVAGQPLTTDVQIREFMDAEGFAYEMSTYARQAAERYPSDWLAEDVPEYDDHDLKDMTKEQRAAHADDRAGYVRRAQAVAEEKVKADPMEFLRGIHKESNGTGHALYLRLSRKYFNAEGFARALLTLWTPAAFLANNLPPMDLLDSEGAKVGVAYDYSPR